ncbi:MAG: hypothetical protein M3P08_14435 [Thermoproteota archaeon]|nr:hypothetical protein [Thermoproteota archaeon]
MSYKPFRKVGISEIGRSEDVSEYTDEYDDLCDKTTEQTKEELMETIKSKGWKYVKSEEISADDL